MAIRNDTLTTAGNNIFLCPADQEHAVTCVVFCNTSASTETISVYAVPSGVANVSTSSQIIKNLELPAGETFTFDTEKFVLTGGDRLHATCSANDAVTATVSSMRVS
jgi:uncharacterized protein (UPF0548 family)